MVKVGQWGGGGEGEGEVGGTFGFDWVYPLIIKCPHVYMMFAWVGTTIILTLGLCYVAG